MIAICVSAAGAALDLWRRRIPNWLTLPVLAAGLARSAVAGGWAGLAGGVLGCLLMAAPYVLLLAVARGGAGDAKLMGALGAWLGLRSGAVALVAVAAAGAVMGLAWALGRRQLRPVLGGSVRATLPEAAEGEALRRMPYGPAIFAGVCAACGISLWLR
jgi:prepilin peptidase CpaA